MIYSSKFSFLQIFCYNLFKDYAFCHLPAFHNIAKLLSNMNENIVHSVGQHQNTVHSSGHVNKSVKTRVVHYFLYVLFNQDQCLQCNVSQGCQIILYRCVKIVENQLLVCQLLLKQSTMVKSFSQLLLQMRQCGHSQRLTQVYCLLQG